MALLLSHSTSRYFWRGVYPSNRTPVAPPPLPSAIETAFSTKDALDRAPQWASPESADHLATKIHCTVLSREQQRRSQKVEAHVWSGPIPPGSFHPFDDNVFVSSPAFEYLQMASSVDERELIAFGDEICGLYTFDASAPRGFRSRRTPLVTKRELQQYLDNAAGCRGYRRALKALRHIVERSASPMETAVEMMACLPYHLGGYGLEQPIMNHPVELTPQAALIARRNTCIADMCYPELLLDIEYHGKLDHDSPSALDSDRERVNGLIEMGYEVIELTGAQVANLLQFEAVTRLVARKTGKRIRREKCGALPERLKLRQLLFAWNRSGGEPGHRHR